MMWITVLFRYWKAAMVVLLALGILGSIGYMHYLKNAAEDARQERDAALSELAVKNQVIAHYEAAQVIQQWRSDEQARIEGTKNERAKRNIATLAQPQNKALADVELTLDMLNGLRE